MENFLLRKDIGKIKAYIPGKPIEFIKGKNKLKKIAKLNSNENALGASPKAKKAIKDNINKIFRYPDGSSYFLKNALAKKLKLKPQNILVGNGSDEIIDIIIKTFLNRGEEIITSQTTFVEYEIIARANGFNAITVPLKDFRYDLKKIEKRVTKNTKIVFIANPNNPTGTYVSNNELLPFINRVAKKRLVVVDEAYLEYTDAKDFPRLLKYIKKKNIIITRTFSKAYGLAGLRVGYAIAKPEFVAAMEKIRQPFNVNSLAQKAAELAINDTAFINATQRKTLKEKYKMYDALRRMKIEFVPTQANFVMFKTNMDALKLCKKMQKQGILIRDLKQYRLDKYARVTIGTLSENRLFLQKLKKILNIK